MENILEQISFYMIIAFALSIIGFLVCAFPVQLVFGMAVSIASGVVFLKMMVVTGILAFVSTASL